MEKYRYTVTLITFTYKKIEDSYEKVEIGTDFIFDDWDDVVNLIGYMTDGSIGRGLSFKVKKEVINEQ